jgi:hypothetical protein
MSFEPTSDQIQTVFTNLLNNEPTIEADIFTGHLGRNDTVPYIVYYIVKQQTTIQTLTDHLAQLTNQVNSLTQQNLASK